MDGLEPPLLDETWGLGLRTQKSKSIEREKDAEREKKKEREIERGRERERDGPQISTRHGVSDLGPRKVSQKREVEREEESKRG